MALFRLTMEGSAIHAFADISVSTTAEKIIVFN